jgi:hypothetical protein
MIPKYGEQAVTRLAIVFAMLIVDSPGDHFTLLKAPNLQFLVKQFRTGIETLGLYSK